MTIQVAVPYYGCPETVEKAIRSILSQTVTDLSVVVIADGEDPPLVDIRDSRLTVYRLPENRGAYFGQQLVIGATPHAWYAQHAADDWSEPDHLERLLAFGTDVAIGAVWYHNGYRKPKIIHKVYEIGLYRTERLRGIGGYNPAERLGQDSLTIHLLRTTGPLAVNQHPTYHRVQRPGSLTTHPDSKKGSIARNEMRARNRAILEVCQRLRTPPRIRLYRERLVPPEIAAELAEHTEKLRALL